MKKIFIFLLLELIVKVSVSQGFSVTNEFRTSLLINGQTVSGFDPSEVYLGEESRLTLQMHNSSNSDLGIYFVAGRDFWSSGFRIVNSADVGVVPAKGSQSLIFRFTPNSRGDKTGFIRIYNRATDEVLFEFTLVAKALSYFVPKLTVSSSEISFNSGTVTTKPLLIRNLGSTPLDITSITLQGAAASSFSYTNFQGLIAPGAHQQIDIGVSSGSSGIKEARLVIESNDDEGPHEVYLNNRGNTIEPYISITNEYGTLLYIIQDVESILFPDTKIGQIENEIIRIVNRGKSELQIDFNVKPLSAVSSTFEVSSQSSRVIVPPEDFVYMQVNFMPKESGFQVSHLTMQTNESTYGNVIFKLEGSGLNCDYWFETYPESLDFGEVEIGKSLWSYLSLFNNEFDPITVTGVSISPASAASEFQFVEYVGELSNTSEGIDIRYKPTKAGTIKARLLIEIENGCQVHEVPIQGAGVAAPEPELTINSNPISFDLTHTGEITSSLLEVENTGTLDLEIYDLRITDGGDFSIAGRSEVIQPGERSQFTLFFSPNTIGEKTGKLTIESNAPSGVKTISLQGEAYQSSFWQKNQSGGIAVQVVETHSSKKAKYVGYEWLNTGTFGRDYKYFDLDNEGYAFIDEFERITGTGDDFLDRLVIFDSEKESIGHINYQYDPEDNKEHVRQLLLVVHNNLFPPYGRNSIHYVRGWDYFEDGEYPVSMLVPPNNKMPEVFDKDPILLVHGWTGWFEKDYASFSEYDDAGYWGATPRLMNNSDEFDTWQIYYPYDMSIKGSWPILDYSIDWLVEEYGQKLRLATHSMGGLVTMSWLIKRRQTAAQKLEKVFFSVPPFYGSYGANRHYESFVGGGVEFFKDKDNESPAALNLGIGSDFIWKLHQQILNKGLPDLNGNNVVSDDYIVMAGVTKEKYSSRNFHEEARNHSDGVVAISSASLMKYGVDLLTFGGNHDDGRYANSRLNSPYFLSSLLKGFFSTSRNEFRSLIGGGYGAVTGFFSNEEVIYPVGKNLNAVSDNLGTIYQKGQIHLGFQNEGLYELANSYSAYYDKAKKELNIGGYFSRQTLLGSYVKNEETGRFYFVKKGYPLITDLGDGVGLYDHEEGVALDIKRLKFYPENTGLTFTLTTDFNYLQTEMVEIDLSQPDIKDITPPTISASYPSQNQEVKNLRQIVLDFDEPVIVGSGSVMVFNSTDREVAFLKGVTHPRIRVVDSKVTVQFLESLPEGKEYHVIVSDGALRDLEGNAFAGLTSSTDWAFKSSTPPVLMDTSPATGAIDFSGNILTMNFSEEVFSGQGGVSVLRYSDDVVIDIIGVKSPLVNINGTEVTVRLKPELLDGEEYYVQIGDKAFRDANVNWYPGISDNATWRFRMATAPTLGITFPADDATDYANARLKLVFSESIRRGYGVISIHKTSDDSEVLAVGVQNANRVVIVDNVALVRLGRTLPPDEDYYVNIDSKAFWDLQSKNYPGISDKTTWNFSTASSIGGDFAPFNVGDEEFLMLEDTRLKVFPNPASNEVTISIQAIEEGDITLSLTDINGKSIETLFSGEMEKGQRKSIDKDLSGLSEGVYMIRLLSGSSLKIEKLVIKK